MPPVAETLTLALVQTETRWHDPKANRALLDGHLERVPDGADLIVLPEMFSTGFTMAADAVAEPMDGATVGWLADRARTHAAAICGSVVVREAGRTYNRFLCALPDGGLLSYDKRHLFRMAGEHEHYAAGERHALFEINGWRIHPAVCYDLRFPVWLRNVWAPDAVPYDLLVVVANWPAARRAAWQTLLRARAIENLAYAAGVNVIGVDGNGVGYSGGTAAYGPDGECLCLAADERAEVVSAELRRTALDSYRLEFPAWQDADRFEVTMRSSDNGDPIRAR